MCLACGSSQILQWESAAATQVLRSCWQKYCTWHYCLTSTTHLWVFVSQISNTILNRSFTSWILSVERCNSPETKRCSWSTTDSPKIQRTLRNPRQLHYATSILQWCGEDMNTQSNVFVSIDNIRSNVISHQRNNEENVCIVLRKLRNNGLELRGANRIADVASLRPNLLYPPYRMNEYINRIH